MGHITIDTERCKGCTLCIAYCPKKSIHLSDELNLKGYFVTAFDEHAISELEVFARTVLGDYEMGGFLMLFEAIPDSERTRRGSSPAGGEARGGSPPSCPAAP